MADYSQKGRPFRVTSPLGEDALLLHAFRGHEAVSSLFEFTVDLLSTNARVDGKGLLQKPMCLELDGPDGVTRPIHGLVRRFVQLGRHEELVSYRAEVVPWLWFLTLGTDCRVFQNLTPVDIISTIFKEQGFTDFTVQCAPGEVREYCVQYRETHFDFVSRLMEEEGIFYFFEHTKSAHKLVLADKATAFKALDGQAQVELVVEEGKYFEKDVITTLEREDAIHTGKVTLRDYDPLQPSTLLESKVDGKYPAEVYDYPGSFTKNADGAHYAKIRLEQLESLNLSVRGQGNVRSFTPGYRFDLTGHYRSDANRSYAILRVEHTCSGGDYRSRESGTMSYSNTFVAIPQGVAYRPPMVTARPVVHGTQSAKVVGPSGEEIFVDKHGRVKVQFFWDRLGKFDDKSSCWVRVSTAWAGKGWGVIQIPRIGQEVLVDFLEGNPDQPIITGRVYNAEQTVPYDLPANMTQSGMKSRSSKGGGTDNFNEIRFEDKKGSEELYIHAEKDESHVVENDRTRSVGHDETVSVGNDQQIDVAKNRTRSVGDDESVSIGKNQSIDVGKDQSLTVGDNRSKSVGKDETTDVGSNRTENVGKDESITIGGNRTETVSKDEQLDVSGKRTRSVGKDESVNIGKKFALIAGDEITLKTGSASITMKKNGDIEIKGKDITLNASGKLNGKASGAVTLKGSTIGQN
jgi:type VI secretion system secreted protein VgrG